MKSQQVVTIGEGSSPMVAATDLSRRMELGSVYVKNEGQNPTGTFKDRCMSVGYSKALEGRAEATVIGSAGNAGAAAAAYAAAAGIPCFVMLPASTSMERVAPMVCCGAHVIKIRGNVSDCIEMLQKVCEGRGWQNMTTAHPCNPFQAEATKTIAYEMARDLGWKAPDWVIVPIGGGGILSGIYKGWRDLMELGMTDRIPKMAGVQEDGCAAVVEAFLSHAHPEEIKRVEKPTGVAVAIHDAFPLDGSTALKAIYDSGGEAVKVSSGQLVTAQRLLGKTTGIFAEPASACTVAALTKLRGEGRIRPDESVVCVVTGSGLKDPAFAIAHCAMPETVEMDEAALDLVIDHCLHGLS